MSPNVLALLLAMARETRQLHWDVRKVRGDDGSRYPRDYYRPYSLPRDIRSTCIMIALHRS